MISYDMCLIRLCIKWLWGRYSKLGASLKCVSFCFFAKCAESHFYIYKNQSEIPHIC